MQQQKIFFEIGVTFHPGLDDLARAEQTLANAFAANSALGPDEPIFPFLDANKRALASGMLDQLFTALRAGGYA
ncbi:MULTISPECIES: hypothetical protein [Thiorhodovibrio]|uniref:hypothetical protein n=1 Tax=Thiorhodovibrio TaxID=61593 RepID=UPI001911ACE2|nr:MULTISPECIES: hypothetical protein [Thiorhodovibrio]MBK5969042.1 hypothetical protein [Thiorhodovibrio winogradskyi]WPL15076.1 hypothetical protein Thiosp_04940 [Thiorhodovibrio litoralis]